MLSRTTSTARVALYDDLADWEFGHLFVELRTGRFTGHPWKGRVGCWSREPITSMGGLGMVPPMILDDLDPADSNLLILPGADMWDAGGGTEFAAAAARYLDAGVPVAAICGATAGLVRAGLLDNRRHTSAAAGDHYVNQRAVVDGISSRPARSRLCTSRRCDPAALGPGIGSQARGVRGRFPPGRHDRLPSARGRPRRSMSVAHKRHHCSAA